MGLAEDARKLREADERKERQEQKWREEEPNERGITMGALEDWIDHEEMNKDAMHLDDKSYFSFVLFILTPLLFSHFIFPYFIYQPPKML